MADSVHKSLLSSECDWITCCRGLSSLHKGTSRDPSASGWLWPEAASDSHFHRSRSLPPTSSEASHPGWRTHPPGSICHTTVGWRENVLKHVATQFSKTTGYIQFCTPHITKSFSSASCPQKTLIYAWSIHRLCGPVHTDSIAGWVSRLGKESALQTESLSPSTKQSCGVRLWRVTL